MRDSERRIRRYRLGRYGSDGFPALRKLRWVWLGVIAWAVWAGLLSEHSVFRLWRMEHENQRMRAERAEVRAELQQLDRERTDAELARERTERLLRERAGMARENELVYRVRNESPDTLERRTRER